ncbi:hypothetical protein CDV31_005286 [Fusarium ambrosium]|uniref:Uncharacterized protein n=1 Tax=Fusarium ambrosium TaxID=131363 RepID=A0A428UK98_9HYPO|nr:hypothetical protein CDV31_005286 [Fusarium ambrosium]
MVLWKQNLNEILERVFVIKNSDDPDYDETRVEAEPSVRRNPPRQARPNLAARLAFRSSSQSSASSILPAPSLTSSQRRQLPSPTAGPLLSPGDAFSAFSGFSDEGRTIDKHRPDEALVNMTMLLLMQGACLPLLQQTSYKDYAWSIVHKQYSITRPNLKKNILTARTDGYLQARRPGCLPDENDALAIIEVKPYRRHNPPANLKAVRIQEGAEMASWICTESQKGLLPPDPTTKTYRRLLVSQDFDHVFLTIAEYDDQYVEYVRGTVDGSESHPPPPLQSDVPPPQESDAPSLLPSDAPPPPERTIPPRLKLAIPKRSGGTIKAIKKKTNRGTAITNGGSQGRRTNAAPTDEPEAAPKQTPGSGRNPGFLRMIEFEGFNLQKHTDIREFTVLLYSLTDYLVSKDLALRGQ